MWSHVDPNFHLRGSVYFDFCDQVRVSYFKEQGMPMLAWRKYNAGPILLEQHIRYFKEILMEETVSVEARHIGLSEDKRFSRVQHRFVKADGTEAARVEVTVAFMDLNARKLMPAPDEIVAILNQLEPALPEK